MLISKHDGEGQSELMKENMVYIGVGEKERKRDEEALTTNYNGGSSGNKR